MVITPLAEDLRRFLAGRALAEGLEAGCELQWPTPEPPGSEASDSDLIRLGRRLQLDVCRCLTLVLKRQWERFAEARASGGQEAGASTKAGDRAAARRILREFHPGACGSAKAEDLFELFEREEGYATRSGYDARSFETLAHQCVLLNLHVLAIHGPEMEAFVASQSRERFLLSAASPEAREAYWLKQRLWREMEDEVGSVLLELECRALENQRVQKRWMETFGASYLALLEVESRFASLERMIRRKEEEPSLAMGDLERMEIEHLGRGREEEARLRRRLARRGSTSPAGPGGTPLEDLETLEYEEDTRKVLREIYRLTHPDAVGHRGFTEAQRERLAACYQEAVACANQDGIDDDEIESGMRSLRSLAAILAQAKRIWECVGLDANEDAVVRGDTLAERLAWLEARIAELEEEAGRVRADLFAVATDPDIREKRASLATEESIARVRGELDERSRRYEARASELEGRLRALFGPEGKGE